MNNSSCNHWHYFPYWLISAQQQNRYTAPLPWIGLYIAGASAVCFLALAVDAVQGFCTKKPWIPCKFFAINAASLTLLAVVVKLPMDLTTSMPYPANQLLKLTSVVLLCNSMSYTMPSLASMTDTDLLLNIVALGILVLTLSVNVVIQMHTGVIGLIPECALVVILILFQFVVLCFSALTVPTTKKILEFKYKKLQNLTSQEVQEKHGNHSVQKLEEHVIISWVMAVTGSPQLVMARSVTSSVSIVICILSMITLVEATIFGSLRWFRRQFPVGTSDYGWSIHPAFWIQYMITLSTMALLTFRFWFTATNFKEESISNLGARFKVEQYWVQHLREWKERPLTLPIRSKKCRKLIQDTRKLILNFAIKFQIGIVLLSKLVHLFSSAIVVSLWSCFPFFGRLKGKISNIFVFSNKHKGAEPTAKELELGHYVLLLEGEAKLPERSLKNIYSTATDFIKKSRRQSPKNLMELLQKSTSFKGLLESDSEEVGCTNSEESLNCWTLPIVNLTSIAIALPNVRYHKTKWLLRSVAEGLSYAHLVEKSLDMNQKLMNISDAADVVWVGVELYCEWLDKNLQKLALEAKTSTETLQILACFAEKIIMGFKRESTGNPGDDTPNWPAKVIAADSLHRISQTLLDYGKGGYLTNEGLFDKICIKIADIFASCLSNLPRVITMKCHGGYIEHREKNVREAARLLGETEDILKVLLQHKIPSLNTDVISGETGEEDTGEQQVAGADTELVTEGRGNTVWNSSG